ncbi:MAG: hypothetical protein V8Q83_06355 [Blautia sp.]
MKNRLISRVCSVLLTAAMLVTSAPASVFAESIGEESVFTDVEAENDFAEPEVEDAQDLESEVVEDVAEEPEAEADQLSDFSDGATVQGTDPVLADGQVDADQVASVSIDMLHAQTEFYEHLTDPCRIVGAVLHITYGDGFTTTLTFNQYSSTVEDNDKGYQWTYTYEKDGQPVSGMLAAGTYDLVLTGKDIRGKGRPDVTVKEGICPITIKARSEAPKLTVGDENHDIASPADGRDSWYQITAPQTGIYVFEPVGDYVDVIEENGDSLTGVDRLFTHPHEFTSVAYPMTAGKIYYVNFRGNISIYDDDGYHASNTASQMKIYQIPGISAVEVDDTNVQKDFVANQDAVSFGGAKVHINYDNGTSYDLEYNGGSVYDEYGNNFSEYIITNDGMSRGEVELEAGEYKIYFTCNDQNVGQKNGYDIRVIPLKEVRTLQSGSNADIEGCSGRNYWYQFTPGKDGTYKIYPMSINSWVYPEKEDSSSYADSDALSAVSEDDNKDTGLGRTYELKAGTTYYLKFSDHLYTGIDENGYPKYANKADLQIKQVPHVKSASTNLVRTELTERWSNTLQSDSVLHISFSDGTAVEMDFDEGTDALGNKYSKYFQNISDEEGKEYAIGSFLPAGTYKLIVKCNGKPVTLNEEYTIHVKALNELTELHEGENKDVKFYKTTTDQQYAWYRFTTKDAGNYVIHGSKEVSSVVREDFGNDYTDIAWGETDDGDRVYTLEGNKTYYIGLGYGWMDVSETVCDLTITKKEDAPDISSTSLELGSMDYTERLEEVYLNGTLTVHYADDTEKEFTFNGRDNREAVDEDYGCVYTYKLQRCDVEDGIEVAPGNSLKAGTYKILISCNGKQITTMDQTYTFQVKAVSQLAELTVGINNGVNSPAGKYCWYRFTAPASGKFNLGIDTKDGNAEFGNVSVYQLLDDFEDLIRPSMNADSYKTYDLVQGTTYYVGFSGGFVVGIDPDDQHLICTDIGTVNIHEYQSEDQIGDKMDEIDSTLEEILENIDEDTEELTEEQKKRINDSVKDLISIDNEELASRGNLNNVLPISEKLAIMANENVTDTVTDVPDKVGKIQVTGAALTALDAASAGTSQDQVLAAKLTVKESGNTYGYTPGNSLVLSIKLSVVDTKNNNQVVEGKENIQPSAPIRVTMPIPDGMDPDNMKLIHVLGDGTREELPFDYEEKDMTVTFLISSLSDYIFTEENQDSDICTAHVPNENGWVTVKEPTCKEAGLKKTTCIKCNTPVEAVIPATGNHSYTVEIGGKAATCSENGYKVLKCATCAETTQTVIPATGNHQAGEWTVVQEATALVAGKKVQKCTVCQKELNVQEIPALPATLTMSVGAKKTVPLKVKQSYTVKVSGLAKGDSVDRFVSSKPKVAAVSNKGKITGKAAGTAVITVKLKSGYSVWFKVKVQKKAVKTIALTVTNAATGKKVAKNIKLGRHKKLKLQATVAPVTSLQKATYTSSNKKVAQAAKNGVITGKKAGTAVITVKSGNKTCKIKVTVK